MIAWSRDAVHRPPSPRNQRRLYDEFGLFRSHTFQSRARRRPRPSTTACCVCATPQPIVSDGCLRRLRRPYIREEVKSLELHEVPVRHRTPDRNRLVAGRPAGASAELRLHPQPELPSERQAFIAHGEGGPSTHRWPRSSLGAR